jgi:uncharacterized membrane protein HdeD (DUF308 family)
MSEDNKPNHKREPKVIWGTLFIVLGIILLVERALNIDILQYFWPAALVALGIGLIVGRR